MTPPDDPALPDPENHEFFEDQDPTLASGGDPEVYEEGVVDVEDR